MATEGSDIGTEKREAVEALPLKENEHALTIVGLGGSAGSIPALQAFFANVPEESGSAYIVVLHLSSEYESHLVEILAHSTRLPVRQVTDTVHIEPNHIYVTPPGKHLHMEDGMLLLREPEQTPGNRIAIDTFFRTLAEAHGPQAAVVVLSGMGADGTLGLRQIKESGGLTVAQAPGEAEFDAMPRSAIATGMVDYVLAVKDMPAQIAAYWETSRQMRLPEEGAPSAEQQDDGAEQELALRDILAQVRAQTGHDFTYYKRATVLRRVGRRMQINRLASLPLYRDFLRSHPAEVGDLISDLLISVTQFFRDRETWDVVEREVIPRVFDDKIANAEVRAWVCGCATGEEAYTLAMLLLEHAERLPHACRVQVFATDMDAGAIARARVGIYPETIAGDVSEERLRRWFYPQNGSYQIRKEVRECVLFAGHDVLRDIPFSRLDLITCRNLLIYLNREAQERVFSTFHFALGPEGRLILGASESADAKEGLFTATDKHHRLFLRRPLVRAATPSLPSIASLPSGPLAARSFQGESGYRGSRFDFLQDQEIPPLLSLPRQGAGRELFQSLMERYGPPTAIVNAFHEILHLSAGSAHFLQLPDGEPTHNLLELVRPQLRMELRTALTAAAEGAEQVRLAPGTGQEGSAAVRVTVRPAQTAPTETAPRYFLVQFEEIAPLPATNDGESSEGTQPRPEWEADSAAYGEIARRLELENKTLQQQLRATVEQYEALTEELKASNEELHATNEEMRSVAEELETGKEELQSVNEELSTVNYELKSRVDEISHTNSDLQNFLAGTNIGTLFLDKELRIKRYTPAAETLFNLIPTDIGRPLIHLHSHLEYPFLQNDVEAVLSSLAPVEREITSRDGERHFIARLLPYRSQDDRIEGAVLNFIDVTERKQAQEALARINEELELRVAERTQELEQMNQLRQALVRQLVTAQEAERARISRDLHDDTGQQISTILLGLHNLKNTPAFTEDPEAQALVGQLEDLASNVAQKSHRLSFTLRPTDLDDIGLMGALRTYGETWSRWSGLPIQVEDTGMEGPRLPRETETTIYRVVQEALTNILRHAAPFSPESAPSDLERNQRVATLVSLLVQRQGATVQVIIEDNGPGFDVQSVMHPIDSPPRLGLFGMQERARLAGGTLEIESVPGEGTTLYLRLPTTQETP